MQRTAYWLRQDIQRVSRSPSLRRWSQSRAFSHAQRSHQQQTNQQNSTQDEAPTRTTNFGFSTVEESQKEAKVGQVFSSVASSYDTMNDLMSLGIHRRWKDYFVRSLDPGLRPLPSAFPPAPTSTSSSDDHPSSRGMHILDIAGGTGDIALRMLDHAARVHGDVSTRVTVADINADMLAEGRKRAATFPFSNTRSSSPPPPPSSSSSSSSSRLSFIEANAEHLDMIPDASVDLYTVAFGIRNFTHKDAALREAHRVLKPGGVFACLEFSKVTNGPFNALYKRWSFAAIPLLGQIVAADRDSYQYLVESIEQFPSQEEFRDMIRQAGFLIPGQRGWENLTGGIAAIHKGVKPLEIHR